MNLFIYRYLISPKFNYYSWERNCNNRTELQTKKFKVEFH